MLFYIFILRAYAHKIYPGCRQVHVNAERPSFLFISVVFPSCIHISRLVYGLVESEFSLLICETSGREIEKKTQRRRLG